MAEISWTYLGIAAAIVTILGIVSAISSIMSTRSSQGAIAWALALITWPFLMVPLYWVFGQNRFRGQVRYRSGRDKQFDQFVIQLLQTIAPYIARKKHPSVPLLQNLTPYPIVSGNDTQLLINGPAIFDAILESIAGAQKTIVLEFYIVRDDNLGRKLASYLIAAVKRGCKVMLLYDEVGSSKLSHTYLKNLRKGGVQVTSMNTTKGFANRLQLNFRNHRKIVVIDGHQAFIGGANVGDNYLHQDKRLTPWRDTHIKITGPAALSAQFAFVEDWHWATDQIPDLVWDIEPFTGRGGKDAYVLPSGPDDAYETCGLFFMQIINLACDRLWIASPYFVPDESIVKALQLAAMRGVDIRIIIPGLADKWVVKQAAFSFIPELAKVGVRFYEFYPGFLHQKVMLVDDELSVIGTANFDNRSFRLNFEISAVIFDQEFATEVSAMLAQDMETSHFVDPQELASRSFLFQVSVRIARLFSPVL